MSLSGIRISNIKVSIKTDYDEHALREFAHISTSTFIHKPITNSFFLFKLNINNHIIVVTIYYRGHVNITGLKTAKEFEDVISIIKRVPGILSIKSCTIDNITASASLEIGSLYSTKLSFTELISHIQHYPSIQTIKYSSQKFPGAFIKFRQGGTVILFPSGKYNILGCKKLEDIHTLALSINYIIFTEISSNKNVM